MSKLKVAVATAALLVGVVFSTGAGAQYVWNGYIWVYNSAPTYGSAPVSEFDNQSGYGYRPRGLPHANGPNPGGGGCYMGQSRNGCGDQ